MMMISAIELAQKLMNFSTVTPKDAGIIDYLINLLEPLGFKCHKLIFEDVTNLYARYGKGQPNFCFAGHTDVVPVGDEKQWNFDPFASIISNDNLYGRGACDMKAAIACFITAASTFIQNKPNFAGSISLLITGDEEAVAINGTVKMLAWLAQHNQQLTNAIVGEPTCSNILGDVIHIGRRGSICFELIVTGKQGHVAYPHFAENPVTNLIKILNSLKNHPLDHGNENFMPSNLEITNLFVGNKATNVIPANASASFNIRFNNMHDQLSLTKWVHEIAQQVTKNYHLNIISSADCFLAKNMDFAHKMQNVVQTITNIKPDLTTDGGTSDARFIKDYCEVIEFGMLNKTAHQVDEHVAVSDIVSLERVYLGMLQQYF
jgi:succinyl-diaminopimelate desuccinylase